MEINQGIVLETSDFTTDADIDLMNQQLQFIGNYKWNMGDVNAVYVPLQLVDSKTGKAYKGAPSKVAYQLCLNEGMEPDAITPQYLLERFMNQTEIRKKSQIVRGYLTKSSDGQVITKRVLAERHTDAYGRYIPDIHDKIAAIISPIHKRKRDIHEAKLKAADLPQKNIDDALRKFDSDNKPIKAAQVRSSLEVVVVPIDPDTFKMKNPVSQYQTLQGITLSLGKDAFASIKAHLHKPGEQYSLDFLEVKFAHPVITGNSDKVNKMQSGAKTKYEILVQPELRPSNVIPNFNEIYIDYLENVALSAEQLKEKTYDFSQISDNEALSYVKDYVMENLSDMTEEERKKNKETLKLFQNVLSPEEIAKLAAIIPTEQPNIEKADNAPLDQQVNQGSANQANIGQEAFSASDLDSATKPDTEAEFELE